MADDVLQNIAACLGMFIFHDTKICNNMSLIYCARQLINIYLELDR